MDGSRVVEHILTSPNKLPFIARFRNELDLVRVPNMTYPTQTTAVVGRVNYNEKAGPNGPGGIPARMRIRNSLLHFMGRISSGRSLHQRLERTQSVPFVFIFVTTVIDDLLQVLHIKLGER